MLIRKPFGRRSSGAVKISTQTPQRYLHRRQRSSFNSSVSPMSSWLILNVVAATTSNGTASVISRSRQHPRTHTARIIGEALENADLSPVVSGFHWYCSAAPYF